MKKSKTHLNVNLSSSGVGEHFIHNCDRYTAYCMLQNPEKIGWPSKGHTPKASQEAGKIWEWDALCLLEEVDGVPCYAEKECYGITKSKENEHYVVNSFREMKEQSDPFSTKDKQYKYADISTEDTKKIFLLLSEKACPGSVGKCEKLSTGDDLSSFVSSVRKKGHGYIYQMSITCPEPFTEQYLLSNTELKERLDPIYSGTDDFVHASWRKGKPDLIRVEFRDGIPVYSVIDLKHAKHMKMGHKAQVATYALLIDALLSELREEYPNLKGYVDMQKGYLWNFKNDEPRAFEMRVVIPYVKEYFMNVVPQVLLDLRDVSMDSNKSYGTFKACPTVQCEWCDNFDNCIQWQKEHEAVTLLPYMSKFAQQYIREHNIPLDIEGFREYTEEPDNLEKMKSDCLGLRRVLRKKNEKLDALQSKIDADFMLQNEEKNIYSPPVLMGVSSLMMPKGENVRIMLTAQRDEATDRIYAFGILISTSTTFKKSESDIQTELEWEKLMKEHKFKFESPKGKAKDRIYHKILIAKSPLGSDSNTIDTVIKEFISDLYNVLRFFSDINKSVEFKDRLTLQGYVMDDYEKKNLEEMLIDELSINKNINSKADETYRSMLVALLFWMMGESMVTESEDQPDKTSVTYPVVVLTQIAKQLFSIPAYITYDMESVCNALLNKGDDEASFKLYKRIAKYSTRLSNTVTGDAIYEVWTGKSNYPERIMNGIRTNLMMRLKRERQLIFAIRNRCGEELSRWPEKFTLANTVSGLTERAAKLITEQCYEGLLDYHEKRQQRMSDPEELVAEGVLAKIKFLDEKPIPKQTYVMGIVVEGRRSIFEVVNGDSFFKKPPFRGILLPAGNPMAWRDLQELSVDEERKSIPFQALGEFATRIFTVDGIREAFQNDKHYISVERFCSDEESEAVFKEDNEFYLMDSYRDFTGARTIAALKTEGGKSNKATWHFLYPERSYRKFDNLKEKDFLSCLNCAPEDGGKTFTDSQLKAFRQLFFNNITLLLGPPGTGKTDFIARCVLTISKYYNNRIKILLSANSHSAINNMLSAIAEKKQGCDENICSLYKLNKWNDDENGEKIEGVTLVKDYVEDEKKEKKSVSVYCDESGFVMGGTCHQALKSMNSVADMSYDLVIIDEASQVRTMDAVQMLQCIKNNGNARILIVGDENQLSPVLRGTYDAEDQVVDIYHSIFRLYYDVAKSRDMDYRVALAEQFRMNEILSRYPASSIYNEDITDKRGYRAFDFGEEKNLGVSDQKLTLKPCQDDTSVSESVDIDMLENILDPEYPLIVCRIHGGDAGEKREQEIVLVTKLVRELYHRMCVPGSNDCYDSEDAFWGSSNGEGGVGIIAPHHEHINRLRQNIATEAQMDIDKIFIGTVDKLQGRQREAVIVSYGVSDPEKAATEMGFIYSRNRLNVAMTRGKKKTIVVLSDTLLDRSVETLSVDDEDVLKGIHHMTGLLDFMYSKEADTENDIKCDIDLGNIKIDVYRKKIRE